MLVHSQQMVFCMYLACCCRLSLILAKNSLVVDVLVVWSTYETSFQLALSIMHIPEYSLAKLIGGLYTGCSWSNTGIQLLTESRFLLCSPKLNCLHDNQRPLGAELLGGSR